MWQLYVLGSLFASATENVIDKASLLGNIAVDFFVASFWRPLLFFIVTVVIGLFGWVGVLHFSFYWGIIALAPIGAFSSLFYTYVLQKVEVTSATAITYIAPILFLFIDAKFLHNGFPLKVVMGIVLLVLGGIGFSINATTRKLKTELTPLVWGMLAFSVFWTGCEAYLFKYLNATQGINGVSFFSSLWLLTSVVLLLIVLLKGKTALLFKKTSRTYAKQSLVSKTFDAISTVLWAQALTFVAVSQVSAYDALYPLILFVLVLVVQGIFKRNLNEKLDRQHIVWKIVATACLVVGAVLVG
jgi:drug/metabolite transporter (DMT)-like permease